MTLHGGARLEGMSSCVCVVFRVLLEQSGGSVK